MQKIINKLFNKKVTLNHLTKTLHECRDQKIIDNEALAMIEGVLNVATMQVRDIMIPRAQMVVINFDQNIEDIVNIIIDSKHSRFPIICEHKDDIKGILLAKDVLNHFKKNDKNFEIKEYTRSVFFVPESKKLDNLLHEFQVKHAHMAIVVDEYGNVAGLVTIEDVIEMIVGDIEDEGFIDDEALSITKNDDNSFVILGSTTLEEINEVIGTNIKNNDFDTIGGLIAAKLGYIPKPGKLVKLYGYKFDIKKSNAKQILAIEVTKN